MQYSIMTFASLAAMASVAFLSVPSQAKAYDYGHGHGHFSHRHGHGHGHFGHRYGHGYRFGGHEYGRRNRGWVRINLEPRESRNEAQVLVDGAHAGVVADFDGFSQRLALSPGAHEIQITLAGHRSFRRQIFVSRSRTYKLRHRLEPLSAAELPEAGAKDRPLARTQRTEPSSSRTASSAGLTSEYGAVRIQAMPGYDHARVYVDGAHAGSVDDFDGLFQCLSLSAGGHDIEITVDGSPIFRRRILVRPRRTYKIRVASPA